jgi:maleylacetoacetate isomerase
LHAWRPIGRLHERSGLIRAVDEDTGVKHTLTQSLAIINFLEAAYPSEDGPLDPLDQAFESQVSEIINSGIQPLQNFSTMAYLTKESEGKIDGKAFGKMAIAKGLKEIENLVAARYNGDASTENCYVLGPSTRATTADYCLVPQLYNARRFEIDVENEYPVLARIGRWCEAQREFVESAPDKQPDAQV